MESTEKPAESATSEAKVSETMEPAKKKKEASKKDVNPKDITPVETEAKPTQSTAGKPALTRSKKTKGSASGKQGTGMPSEQKLEHLAAAVTAAGDADNLLTILEHVEAAGGGAEVVEAIETYRALKMAVEQSNTDPG